MWISSTKAFYCIKSVFCSSSMFKSFKNKVFFIGKKSFKNKLEQSSVFESLKMKSGSLNIFLSPNINGKAPFMCWAPFMKQRFWSFRQLIG